MKIDLVIVALFLIVRMNFRRGFRDFLTIFVKIRYKRPTPNVTVELWGVIKAIIQGVNEV